ncbi:uncharacterized protein LOC133192958 [Saccostrea echinata]|uniref:uncharacterized protein LOC133192958 n=1 Tax=Saccostrea echinata TaxID=191078 RepID=UPI002A7FF641|nr:uncharacterized protein LOC133192958 [Saccostrea echinata]
MTCGNSPVRLSMGTFVLILMGTLLSMIMTLCFCLNCVSPSGKPVDWYIIYKVPKATREMPIKTTGEEFYYLDALNPVFSYIKDNIQEKQNNPLFNTLQQIYDGKAQVYAMYNDNPPPHYEYGNTTLINQTSQWIYHIGAHMKGAYAFDENDGFWLISSIPCFPAPQNQGYSYTDHQLKYAQSVLCVTLDKKYLTEMKKTFYLTKPIFYDGSKPDFQKLHHSSKTDKTSTVVPFTSKGEQKFLLFAKSDYFGRDLYDSLVAVKLEDNLFVETWKPNLPSNCSTHYEVHNVKKVKFDNESYWFPSTMDHAKWAVAEHKPWTCIGDINRNESQLRRGGGTMCLYHKGVASLFRELIKLKAFDSVDRERIWKLLRHYGVPCKLLDDLDFADDLALMQAQMQEKITTVEETSAQIGLNINIAKTKILSANTPSHASLNIEGKEIEEVEHFTYLGSILDQQGRTEADIKARIGKARVAFLQLGNIWKTKGITTRTKVRLFNSNVKAVLLYGSETWRMTVTTTNRIQTFVNSSKNQNVNTCVTSDGYSIYYSPGTLFLFKLCVTFRKTSGLITLPKRYIMYKIPRPTRRSPANTTGKEFYYMDSVNPVFTFKDVSIQEEKENPLFKTLQQIYEGKSSVYAMYNDERPDRYTVWFTAKENRTFQWETNGGAHMKGAYAFDENEGFWLILSIPKFPAPRKQGYSYGQSQIAKGQSILCVTLDKQYLRTEMEKIFYITKPTFYDRNNVAMKTGQKYISSSAVVGFKSKGGQKFRFFAKSDKFGMDLYDSLVALDLKDNLYVETWYPNLKSNCSTKYKVYNVEKVRFGDHYNFLSTTDHSKWVVAESKQWTCIGDINRNTSQFKRGGGTMCLNHQKVSKQFREIVGEFNKC